MSQHETLIVLQPTSFCNIDCSYCYLPDRSSKQSMSDDVLEAIFQRVFESDTLDGPFAFLWHLGEPLAVPISFYERAFRLCEQHAAGIPYIHSFQTNGTLITPEWVRFIKANNIVVGVSIDGPAFLHDARRLDRRGRGTHARTMAGIKILQGANVPFSVIAVLSDASLDYPNEIFDFFSSHEIDDIAFNIDEMEGINTTSSHARDDSVERYKRFLESILHRIDDTNGRVKVREVWKTARTISMVGEGIKNTTNEPFRIVNIASNGDFSTWCPELLTAQDQGERTFVIGNVLSTSFSAAANGERFSKLDSAIARGRDACEQNCDYWKFCGGGAPANKFFEHGRLDLTETNTCRIHLKATVDVMLDYLDRTLAT